jgi:hypothetical protein
MTKRKAAPRSIRDIYLIAIEASADPRTVQKYLAGKKVRGQVADRIRAVVEAGK